MRWQLRGASMNNVIRWFTLPGKIALLVFCLLVFMAVAAPWLATHSPYRSTGPALSPPSQDHWMGTDQLGLDLWAMILYGARTSLLIGMGTALFAGLGGGIAGIIAGWYGGWIDRLLMRLVDILMAIPRLPAMIVLAAFFGAGMKQMVLVLSLFSWAAPARTLKGTTLSLKEQPYIRMAAHHGAGLLHMLGRHLIPEMMPLLLISMIRLSGRAIVAEASLAFLGLGDPTSRSWGLIINHAVNFTGIYLTPYWQWWLFYPWLFITLLVTSLALVGCDLETLADPRMRSR
ncbi:ABC transporter permease [Anoxynatronum sibiricum]|uniref:ABC transporter permease n=1 Tax=Anoxynatronum sibiricum TaxID=210623 RepID=A0ABU9VS13_9CLOT